MPGGGRGRRVQEPMRSPRGTKRIAWNRNGHLGKVTSTPELTERAARAIREDSFSRASQSPPGLKAPDLPVSGKPGLSKFPVHTRCQTHREPGPARLQHSDKQTFPTGSHRSSNHTTLVSWASVPAGTLASPACVRTGGGTSAGRSLPWCLGNYSLCLFWAKTLHLICVSLFSDRKIRKSKLNKC